MAHAMVKSGMKQLAATSGDRGDLGAPHFELGSWVNKKHLDELNMPIYGMDMGWILSKWFPRFMGWNRWNMAWINHD